MAQPSSAQREPSMEEILASIRRIIEDSDGGQKPPVAENDAPMAPVSEDRVAYFEPRFAEEPAVQEAPELPQAEQPAELPSARIVEMRRDVVSSARPSEPASSEVESLAPAEADVVEPSATQISPEEPAVGDLGSIISDHARKQVAASFGELSDVFAASRRRSFDDIAAEMMRPMLQEWMDNNLPLLVERLVREEIERVARGG